MYHTCTHYIVLMSHYVISSSPSFLWSCSSAPFKCLLMLFYAVFTGGILLTPLLWSVPLPGFGFLIAVSQV